LRRAEWPARRGGRVLHGQENPRGPGKPGPYKRKRIGAQAEACATKMMSGLGRSVPHFLLDFPLAGGVLVEDEKNFSIAFHGGLIGWLEALRLQAPLGGPVAGNLDVAEIDFFADNFVAGHLSGDVVDKLSDRGTADHGSHAGKKADTVVGPHGDYGGIVHAKVGVDEFFVEREDFGFRVRRRSGSLGSGVKEKERGKQQKEGKTTRSEHERTS